MNTIDWLQLALFIGVVALITKPLGIYLTKVIDPDEKTFLDPIIRPIEHLTYAVMGVDRHKEENWKQYTLPMLFFSVVGCVFTCTILRRQQLDA